MQIDHVPIAAIAGTDKGRHPDTPVPVFRRRPAQRRGLMGRAPVGAADRVTPSLDLFTTSGTIGGWQAGIGSKRRV